MISSTLRKLHAFSRRLLVRVLLIAALVVLAVALAKIVGAFLPPELDGLISAQAVDNVLSIIANSMLTVTTFSLTVMAAAHRMVSNAWTPRAHQMLLEDTTTHTVLATFVGAYLYALMAIILRDMDVFRAEELVVLFAVTVLVVVLIVTAIIRWISHLEMLGSLIETAQRIEDRTAQALTLRSRFPTLGARVLDPDRVPAAAITVRAETSGYLRQVYQDVLQEAAETAEGHVWLALPVGEFVYQGQVLARVDRNDDRLKQAVRDNLLLGSLRNFDQDPEFGLLCLSEIGVRALSPGVNDPGTAVDMLRRMGRVMMSVNTAMTGGGEETPHDRLFLPALDTAAMVRVTLGPLLMDGADRPELAAPVDQLLEALRGHADRGIAAAADRLFRDYRASSAFTVPEM